MPLGRSCGKITCGRVIVDFQNNHHEDFQRINPKTLADCDRLVLERLEKHLANIVP